MAGEGAVVVDVGINMDPEGNLCGDVDFEAVGARGLLYQSCPQGRGERHHIRAGTARGPGGRIPERTKQSVKKVSYTSAHKGGGSAPGSPVGFDRLPFPCIITNKVSNLTRQKKGDDY